MQESRGVGLERDPRRVYGRQTGRGPAGPMAQKAGNNIDYIALTGALNAIGPKDRPPSIPLNLVGDFGGGAMYLALGLVLALIHISEPTTTCPIAWPVSGWHS